MTLPNTPEIRVAEHQEATSVATLIATAFADLEVAQWLVADRQERIRALAGQFAMLVEHACTHGYVYTVNDRDDEIIAAAVWFDYTKPVPEPAGYSEKLAAVTGENLNRFETLDDAFAAHHPEVPHHHFAFMGTHPRHQSRGCGSALLNHHHAILNRDGVGAYLEASNKRTRDLYAKHGYQAHEKTLNLPDGPVMWPMWRPAPK